MPFQEKKLSGKKNRFFRHLFFFFIFLSIFTACSKVSYNYTSYLQGTILKGEMADGRTLYLIRDNNSGDMTGNSFVYAGKAIVNLIPYVINTSGTISFNTPYGEYKGQIRLNKKNTEIALTLPDMPEYGIQKQALTLIYWDIIDGKLACHGRYSKQAFDSIIATKDIVYGIAKGHYISQPIDTIPHGDIQEYKKLILSDIRKSASKMDSLQLLMDIYQPYDENINLKPAFLFLHGGGFFMGDKENKLQQTLTGYLVKRGYIVVSIDYRLGSTIFGVKSVEKLIYSGVQDARAALRFITHYSEDLGIDPNQIYIGGSSAGAIIALNTAFMDEDEVFRSAERRRIQKELGGLNTSGNDFRNNYSIAGVISMWGAVVDLDIIDGRNADIPVLLFHGTADNIVPIDSGLPFQNRLDMRSYNRISENWKLYGSESIYNHMNKQKMPVALFTFEGYGHEPQVNKDGTYNDNIFTIERGMNNFMYKSSHKELKNYSISGNISIQKSDSVQIYEITNTENEKIKWHIDGGLIINRIANTVSVVWYDTYKNGKVSACVTNDSGESEKVELQVRIHPQ